jgi:hemoglobin/transferrin/lactoferrin receptor protein
VPLSTTLLALLLAASVPPDETEAFRLDGVLITANGDDDQSSQIGPAVTHIDAAQIAAQAPSTIADLLRGQVGAHVQQTTPGQGNVLVRGLKGSEVLHLVDGMRLNNAFFRNAPNQYLGLVDAHHVEAIELVRGPLSTLYGGDAMGGVLKIHTPEPRFSGEHWQSRGQLRTVLSSADRGQVVHARQAIGREGIGLSASLTRQDYGERRVGGGQRLPHTAFEAEAASLRLALAPSPVSRWLLGVDLSRQPQTPRHDALVPGFGQSQPESELFLFEPNQRRALHLRQRWLAASLLWDSLEWQLARQVIDDDRRSRDFGSTVETRERNRSTQDSFNLQLNRSFDRGDELILGVEWLHDAVDSARQRRDSAADAPPRPVASRYPDGSSMESRAVHAQHGWPLTAATRLTTGLRYSDYRVVLPAAGPAPGVMLDFDDLTGSLGLVHKLDDGVSLVSNLGRGFRPPNVFDLGTLGPRPGNRFNLPNPALKPESLVGFDVGLRLDADRWQAEAFLFRSHYRDKITAVFTGEFDDAGRQLVQSRNATRLILQGVEAGLRWRAARWSFGATLTYTHGDEQLDGEAQPADRIGPLSGRLELDWAVRPGLDTGLALRYAARQDRLSLRDRADPRIDPDGTPGHAVFDASLALALSDAIDLRLRLDNLGDRRHRSHGSGLDEPGRNLGLGIEWRY